MYKCGRDVKEEIEKEKETEFQEKYLHMPKIGTRVRRGQDWKWKNQDGQGPGTVVGHSKRSKKHYNWQILTNNWSSLIVESLNPANEIKFI